MIGGANQTQIALRRDRSRRFHIITSCHNVYIVMSSLSRHLIIVISSRRPRQTPRTPSPRNLTNKKFSAFSKKIWHIPRMPQKNRWYNTYERKRKRAARPRAKQKSPLPCGARLPRKRRQRDARRRAFRGKFSEKQP